MRQLHFIGLDTHCQFCEVAVITQTGKLLKRDRCDTKVTVLRAILESVPRPRHLVIEEGPLADWLYRNLRDDVDSMTVSEPRRNRLIALEGDKDDDLDAEKLAQLLRGGYVKVVHQTDSLERTVFKQHVALYQQGVRQRVRQGQQLASLLKRHGVMAKAKDFASAEERPALLARLPANPTLQADLSSLFLWYDMAGAHEELLRRRLVDLAKQDEVVQRFEALPGISWVRAATLYAYLDTPWRFRSPKALWKYLGIGLERRRSGNGPEYLSVPWRVNRLLKSTILGAARSAIVQGENPFADQYGRWCDTGLTPKLAKRNVARSLAATLWGLWKNGTVYHPAWVGVNLAATKLAEGSWQVAAAK